MNGGRDVERLIAGWLAEEAPGRAPDRILESAADAIDRTRQRRFGAAWREPMTISLRGLALAAAVIIVVAVGAAWMGRSTASIGAGPSTPSPSPTASASPSAPDSAALLATYRAARNEICAAKAAASPIPNNALWGFDRLYDPAMSADDRALSLEVGRAIADQFDAVAEQLETINPPPALATEHLENITHYRDLTALIRHEVDLLADEKLVDAQAVDVAANDSISSQIDSFETKYALQSCG